MTAPGPLNGANPYTGMYQKRQFKTQSPSLPGSNAIHNGKVGAQTVWDAISSPPAAAVTAEGQDPITEEVYNEAHPQTGIIPN